MKLKVILITFISVFLLTSTASATLSYSSISGVVVSTSDNIHNLPQLYSSLVGLYGQSYTDQNIMTQLSSGIWWISTGLLIPDPNTKFYINDSTCSELRIGKNTYDVSLSGYPIINNTKLVCWVSGAKGSFNQSGTITLYNPIHDTNMNNFQLVSLEELSYCSVYNLSLDSTKYYLTFPNANYITADNITITNGDPVYGGGLENFYANNCIFSNISTKNTGDYTYPATGSYGLCFSGSNNVVKDCVFNGSAWSTFNIFGSSVEANPTNNTITNVTVINSGHNGFEFEGNNSTFKNISVYNSKAHNFFQVGKQDLQKMSVNNTYENIYSYNPGTSSFKISEGSDNITVKNITIIGNGFEIDDASNSTVINCYQNGNAPVKPNDQCGYRTTIWSGYFAYNRHHTVIDSNFINNSYFGICQTICESLHIVNCNYTYVLFNFYSPNDYTTYYYPNITVKNLQGLPVQNAVITVNTSALNGFGKSQTSFYTDSNGKLYSYGNRTNWLAIPDQIGNETSTTYCITNITASRSGKTNSTTADPSSSWYSPNPASLNGSEIVLTLDTNSSVSETYSPYDLIRILM